MKLLMYACSPQNDVCTWCKISLILGAAEKISMIESLCPSLCFVVHYSMNQGLSILLFYCPNDISFVSYKGITSNNLFNYTI